MRPTWAWVPYGESWELHAGGGWLASVWLRRTTGHAERLWSWSIGSTGRGPAPGGDGLLSADAAKAAAERALWCDE